MWMRRGVQLGVTLGIALGFGGSVWATIENLKSFKQAYPGKEPKAYTCKLCHENAVGKKDDLNAYGLALQQLKAPADPKKLTEKDYRAVEPDDADADGASNLDELTAGTDPSDSKAVPKHTAPKSPPHEKPSSQAPSVLNQLQACFSEPLVSTAWADETKSASTEDTAPKQAGYVGMETCAMCHAKQAEEFKHSTHGGIAVPGDNVKAQGCETCHGPGSLHAEAGGGKGVGGLINPNKDPTICFSCHLDKKAQFRLTSHHPLLEGKMSCSDCHSAHGEDVRPWSATTLKDVNEACFKCHKDQRGPFVWEHEALREGCTTCHQVHGSIHDKMLMARDNTLCLRCHTQVNFPTIGKSGHGTRLPQGTCFSGGCHTAVHGSNFDAHLRY